MDLRFTSPDLAALDQIGTEVLVAGLLADEQPPRGVAGLVDWRLAGTISRLIVRGFATGSVGEVVLVQGKPRLPFEKILLLGLGARDQFDEDVFQTVTERLLRVLEGLRARTAVVELPGRHFGAIGAERATDLLLTCAGESHAGDVWTLVERVEAQRNVHRHIAQERRRVLGS